jgi:bacterioferritin
MSQDLIKKLNQALSEELQVSIQYMYQHIQQTGIRGFIVQEELRKISIEEMKHAELLAERIDYLGGVPTPIPAKVSVGEKLDEMFLLDITAEKGTIDLYKEIFKISMEEGDVTTGHIVKQILQDEEEHLSFFESIMENE